MTPAGPLLVVPSNPTPNGDLHVGHLAGPFVAADVCRRAALHRGEDARLLLGTAWQESHVELAAERSGVSANELVDRHTAEIAATFAAARIKPDAIVDRDAEGEVSSITHAMLAALSRAGLLESRQSAIHECARCERTLVGGFVVGICPHCHHPGASATGCEECARYHDDAELIAPACALCGGPAGSRMLSRRYLRLERLRSFFECYHGNVSASPSLRRYLDIVHHGPFPDVAVDVPGGSRVEAMFTLAPRFLVAISRFTDAGLARPSLAAAMPGHTTAWDDHISSARVVLLFGFDNAFERAFLFPAMLAALDGAIRLPEVMLMSHFYRLDGEKFSTSRGHLVGARELIGESSADEVRYHVSATRPEHAPTDFSLDDYRRLRGHDPVAAGAVWVADVLERAGREVVASDRDDEVAENVDRLARAAWMAYQPTTFSCRAAAAAVAAIVARRADFARRRAAASTGELEAVRLFAQAVSPIAPELGDRLQATLRESLWMAA